MADLGVVEIKQESDASVLATGQGSEETGGIHVVLNDVNAHLQQGTPYMITGIDGRGWRNLTFVGFNPANPNTATFDATNAVTI